jgi:predicted metal-binding transcription factor (methanogenesis marker protein 9)
MLDFESKHTNRVDPNENYGNPESFFVFIVGINGQWEDGRSEEGDIALYNAYLSAGVPPDQVVFVKDQKATKSNCESELKRFLKHSHPSSTFLFYYGGHGQPTGFSTHEEEWRHQDVVDLIDSSFSGDRVIVLADCCGSGNFCKWLQKPLYSGRHSYVCIMSTAPYTEAGAAWTMTSNWMTSMRCSGGSLQLRRVIDFLSDETARKKGDLLVVFLSKDVHSGSCTWLPQLPQDRARKKLSWRGLKHYVPQDAKVTSRWNIGDIVYYKHPGGPCPTLEAMYVPPVWLRATIQSKLSWGRRLKLEVSGPAEPQLQWTVEVSRKELLNDLYMAPTCMVPDKFYEVQCELAMHCKYFDYSLPPSEKVKVIGRDGDTHDAVVMDWKDVDWKAYLASGSCNDKGPVGPYVAISWIEHKETSIMPLERVIIPGHDVSSASEGHCHKTPVKVTYPELSRPQDALTKSIESCGKEVCDARQALGTSRLACFWPEDGEWYDAEALDPSSVPLEVLASHALFAISGPYCPVHYEDDEIYLTPLHYVRRKVCPFSRLPCG